MVIQQILENGVRVVMEPMQGVRSVAVGIWVNAGSVREAADEAGASHFIEHMVFKGTGRRSAADIAAEMDNVGGSINAFTSKECTCYYAKVLDEHLPIAVDMLADIVFHSAFDPEELEKERRVIHDRGQPGGCFRRDGQRAFFRRRSSGAAHSRHKGEHQLHFSGQASFLPRVALCAEEYRGRLRGQLPAGQASGAAGRAF